MIREEFIKLLHNTTAVVLITLGFMTFRVWQEQDNSYVQTVPNHRRLLIIDDKSLPHKQRRASTRLLIFKIKFSSEPPVED